MVATKPPHTIGFDPLTSEAIRPGVIVSSSNFVPEGQVYGLGDSVIFVGPLTFWSLAHEGRWPMLSRYSRGMIELERDRRQRQKEKR